MEYGVQHYESVERLRWFLVFIFCALLAYPFAAFYGIASSLMEAAEMFRMHTFASGSFWLHLPWLRVQPLGGLMVYLTWLALLFLVLKSVFLVVQLMGKRRISSILENSFDEKNTPPRQPPDWGTENVSEQFSPESIMRQTSSSALQFAFHPFRRIRLMLNSPRAFPASETFLEKERRASEVDWEIMSASWTPFQWILWALPLVALSQVLWLVHDQIAPLLSGQQELQEIFIPQAYITFLPLAQALALVLPLALAAGLLKRLENLYLSSLNALIYDNFVSRLPFQSGDTIILLESLRKNSVEIQSMLRRLERSIAPSRGKNP